MTRRCQSCGVILVPEPRIEKLIGEDLKICMSCLVDGVKYLEWKRGLSQP